MRVFVAGLMHETSSFSPIPTTRRSFEQGIFHRPDKANIAPEAYELMAYGTFLKLAQERGYEVVPSLFAFAEPSAPCAKADYEALRDEILDDLRAAGPIDMVLLIMHGAQMAEGYPDCEGDVLARVRKIVGPKAFVGAEFDLHANVTEGMTQAADVILACRYYPHTDFEERARELFSIGERFVLEGIETQLRYRHIPMLGMFYTTEPGMAEVTAAAQAMEGRDGVLAVSLVHGFPWADHADVGAGVLIAAEAGRNDVEEKLAALARDFYAIRRETQALRRSIDDILDEIQSSPPTARPFVIGDAADNPGGGAGSDSTFILEAMLRRGVRGAAIALLWDPLAAHFARDVGVGGAFKLRLGGKTGPAAGNPLDVLATVRAVSSHGRQNGIGLDMQLGLAAALEIEGNLVVVNTKRQQAFSPACFTELGIDPEAMRILVVKSSQHFHDQFAPLAEKVFYCETPGSLTLNFDAAAYRQIKRPMWPFETTSLEAVDGS